MKVLLIGHESDLNGASKSLLNIIDILLNNDYSVYVLTSYKAGAFYDELKKRPVEIIVRPFERWCVFKPRKIKWIMKKILWMVKDSNHNKFVAKKLAKYVLDNQIDIIHSNTSVINIGALISKYSGVPHIWHLREFGDLDFNMHFLEPKSRVYKFMNMYTEKFICISKAIRQHYDSLAQEKKVLIYNGVGNDNIIDISEKKINDKVSILIAGRVSPEKGQHEAVTACEELLKQGVSQFELYIAGGDKLYFNVSKQMENHLHILGKIKNMPEIRKGIDIELVCSRAEAFGRVTVEAMLAGIPVIGSNTGGTTELINDGVDGFLYEKGNTHQLAEKLRILIEDKELRMGMGVEAQKKAKQQFLIERCVSEIEQVYRQVVIK